ncbi:hypothetical protein NTE_00261 [Candidatus Nitrososphaera evergladensis SR1]|uniref:Uncharacterized protein n=1 Tax=Candidatus Nitrososphaera evergladensis SR1 TaxID=1459636 RepID=A0A075MM60_9ARCH|nr:hypothetical protein NTE_00261 [Candidatus Nitrososphaera evergladensis SR1]
MQLTIYEQEETIAKNNTRIQEQKKRIESIEQRYDGGIITTIQKLLEPWFCRSSKKSQKEFKIFLKHTETIWQKFNASFQQFCRARGTAQQFECE